MHSASTLAAHRPQASWTMHLWGLAGGLGFTGVIAAGLAFFSRSPPAPPPDEEAEIRSVEIPEPPPPPPPQLSQHGTPLPPAPLIFEEAPSTSTVRLAPTPIPITPLITEVRPTFSLRFDYSPGQFRPGDGDWEPNVDHVFQRSEVDQHAIPIFRKVPQISMALLNRVKNPRVRVLLTVNTDGTVENVRLMHGQQPEFDRIVVEAIREWRFRAAMRKGKKVRQLVELPLYVKPPNASPFSVN